MRWVLVVLVVSLGSYTLSLALSGVAGSQPFHQQYEVLHLRLSPPIISSHKVYRLAAHPSFLLKPVNNVDWF